nr:unnamed protein product [Naegleria fowleri]
MFDEKIQELKKLLEHERKENERLERRCEHLESIKSVMTSSPPMTAHLRFNNNAMENVANANATSVKQQVSVSNNNSHTESMNPNRETVDSIKPLFRQVEMIQQPQCVTCTNQNEDERSTDDDDGSTSSSSDCESSCSTLKKKRRRRVKRGVEPRNVIVDAANGHASRSSVTTGNKSATQENKETTSEGRDTFNASSTVVVRRKQPEPAKETSSCDNSILEDQHSAPETDISEAPSIGKLKDFAKLQEECNNEFKDYTQKMKALVKDISMHGKELVELRSAVKHIEKRESKKEGAATTALTKSKTASNATVKKKRVLKSASPLKKK